MKRKVSAAERKRRSEAATMLGRGSWAKAGRARMASLTPEERRRLALKGARAFKRLSKGKRRAAALKAWETRRAGQEATA